MAHWKYEQTRLFLRANPIDTVERAIITRKLFWPMDNLQCSSCNKITMVWSSIDYDYCPHCGAKMN